MSVQNEKLHDNKKISKGISFYVLVGSTQMHDAQKVIIRFLCPGNDKSNTKRFVYVLVWSLCYIPLESER